MVDPYQIDPEGISRRDFTTAFRGFDQVEVRAFLSSIATQLRRLLDEHDDLRQQLEAAQAQAAEADNIDEHRLAELLGEETTRIFEAAREAAAEIRAKAEAKTAQLVREAQDEAHRMTDEANDLLRVRTTEAEAAATTIRGEAEADRDKMLADARVEVEEMRAQAHADADRIRDEAQVVLDQATADAEATVEAARQQGREMVSEAQVVRERILKDLARRRRTGKAQLEQLRAARERLLEAYALVRRTVDEATTELTVAVPEAKLAADAAARRVELEDDDLTVEAIEAELDAGRVAGVPLLDTGEVPVVRPESVADESGAEPVSDEPEAEPAPEPEIETMVADAIDAIEADVAEMVEPEPEPDQDAEPEVEPDPAPVVDLFPDPGEPTDSADPTDQTDSAGRGVEDLFARLRSEVPEPEADAEPEEPSDPIDEVEAELAEIVVPDESAVVPDEPVEPEEPGGSIESVEEDEAPSVDAVDEALLDIRDRHLGGLDGDLARLLKRHLSDDENLQLDLIRRGPAKGGSLTLPPIEEHRQAFLEAASDTLVLAAAAGIEFAHELLDTDSDLGRDDDPAGDDVLTVDVDLDDIAVEMVDALLVPIRERVAEVLEDRDGDDALDGVRAYYRQGKGAVSGVAAQFVHTAFNRGVFDAIPDDSLVRWVVDPAGGPCPDGEDDALEGPITKGTPFPTGHLHPPAHPGCRCLLVPAVL